MRILRLVPAVLIACKPQAKPPEKTVSTDPAITAPSRVLEASEEPPMLMSFEANGTSTTFTESQPFEVDVNGTKVKATVRIASYRMFHQPGIRFRYPRQFTFEADHEPDLYLWTLSGNDARIMLQKPKDADSGEQFAAAVVSSMIGQFGVSNVKKTAAVVELGGKSLAGTRLDINVAGHQIRTEVFPLPMKSPMLLLFQDSPTDAGENTVEATQARELLSSSLVLD